MSNSIRSTVYLRNDMAEKIVIFKLPQKQLQCSFDQNKMYRIENCMLKNYIKIFKMKSDTKSDVIFAQPLIIQRLQLNITTNAAASIA